MTTASAGGAVALVTGSHGGIGSVIVRALRRDGLTVVGADLKADDGPDDLRADISDRAESQAVVKKVLQSHGRLDIVVLASGMNMRQSFADLDLSAARALVDVNVWGAVNLLSAAAPSLCASPCASVVVLTSTSGQLGFSGSSIYAMSKAALGGLVRALAVEWAEHPVRVNAVGPAIVETPMNAEVRQVEGYMARKVAGIPMGRPIEADEVAETVAFLAGPRSGAITGHTIYVDGGAVVAGH